MKILIFRSTLICTLALTTALNAETVPASRRGVASPAEPVSSASNVSNTPPVRPSERLKAHLATLPPAPEGVADLSFDEFFKMPVGARGLEVSDKLQALEGKRVRLLGFMVKQTTASPWTLLLAPLPLSTHESHYGLAEDLPPTTVRVLVPRNHQPITPYTPGLLLLTGRLEVGNRAEADGRSSIVRLHLDPKGAALPVAAAPTNAPTAQISAP